MRGIGPRTFLQGGGKFGIWKKQDVIKPFVRSCFTQRDSSNNNSTVLEQSRIKFDMLLDRSTIYHLDGFSGKSPTPVSIKGLLEQAYQPTQQDSFKYITKELPVRLANMIMELQMMPRALSSQPQFQEILFQYIQSFKDLLVFSSAPFNSDTNERFVSCLKEIRFRHIDTVPTMAGAIQGMMAEDLEGKMAQKNIQYCLDRLYTNRISIHLLISMYRAVFSRHKKGVSSNNLMIGTLDPDCDVISVAREAYEDAAYMCDREFHEHPKLEIEGRDILRKEVAVDEIKMSYMPNHLHHIFFETFKNAMRATVENSKKQNLAEMPPVKCLVTKSEGDISIRVSDQGGGISREIVEDVFLYHFTSAQAVAKEKNVLLPGSGGLESQAHPMHGLGYGLPLSRVYARYFQGDLNLISMHGLGSDVYIYLKALSDDAKECLPKYSIQTASKLHSKKKNRVSDWTL